jgi:ophiobolin F synthase
MEGLTLGGDTGRGSKSKDHVKRRQLQAKMVMELMEVDKEQAKETLRLWKEMSEVFVRIRDMKFTTLDPYLKVRVVDAGCPYVNSLRSRHNMITNVH